VALVDLYPFQPIALDPPPFQQAEAPTDGRQTDPSGPTTDAERSTGCPVSGAS